MFWVSIVLTWCVDYAAATNDGEEVTVRIVCEHNADIAAQRYAALLEGVAAHR